MNIKILFLAMIALFLSACSSSVKRGKPPAPIVDRGQPVQSNTQDLEIRGYRQDEPVTLTPMHIPAVDSLLHQAKNQQAAGNLPAAVSTLERAVRMAPKDAWLWHELAKMTKASGNSHQARQQAKKSNSLAGGDQALKQANHRLIVGG